MAVSSANFVGRCRGGISTAVPSLRVVVLAAMLLANTRDAEPSPYRVKWCSAIQALLNPNSSPNTNSSVILSMICLGSVPSGQGM